MGTIDDAKDVAKHQPFTIAIPTKQGIMLMSRDLASDTHSQPICPAYRFCKKFGRPYHSPIPDSDDQQITTLHDLLQAIKEAALKLAQLIAINIEDRRKRNTDSSVRYLESRQYERSNQPRSPGSGLIATSSSICALCGVALHLKGSSEELRRVCDYTLPKESKSVDVPTKGQKKIFPNIQPIDTSESEVRSKLLFISPGISSDRSKWQTHQDESQQKYDKANQSLGYMTSKYEHNINGSSKQQSSRKAYISPKTSSTQDASTLAQLCPCACGLLVRDETESEVSINKSLSTLKDKLIKTKLEELGFYLDSKEVVRSRMHNDIQVRKTKMQKLKRDLSIKHWKEETVQLQVQIEELRESIQFFEQENEYIRRLTEKCRCLSDKRRDLQQLLLPINITHSGLTTTIQYLQAKYHNEHGIIASLTEIFQGSTKNIQQVATKLLAPFIEYWHQNPTDSIVTKRVPSASSTRILLKPSSSIFNVY